MSQLPEKNVQTNLKQESIPVGCLPPALHHTGGLCPGGLPDSPPGQTPPPTNQDRVPPKEHGTRDRDPLEGTWDQAARQEDIIQRPPLNTQNETCF